MSDQLIPTANDQLIAQLEALLFVAPGPVTIVQLAGALNVTPRLVEKGLDGLRARYLQDQNISIVAQTIIEF